MITFSQEFQKLSEGYLTYGYCWIYLLLVAGIPYYVGSTKEIAARYINHFSKTCKDTRPLFEQYGSQVEMRIVDITLRENQIVGHTHEGIWIRDLRRRGFALINSEDFDNQVNRYDENNSDYPSLLNGLLKLKAATRN